jgi:hypothetical protein
MSGGWWILVEAPVGTDDSWTLVRTIPVDGGRGDALAKAAEVARTCSDDGREARELGAYGRRVFRTAETGWLVEVSRSAWHDGWKDPHTFKTPVRISIAELEYERETPVPEPPAKSNKLRRALGRS